MKNKRFRKVRKYHEFLSNEEGKDWLMIFLLSIPIISTIIVLYYLILGKKETYWEEIK